MASTATFTPSQVQPDPPKPLFSPTTTRTAVLCIDIQAGLEPSPYFGSELSTPTMATNVARLLKAARDYNASLPTPAESHAQAGAVSDKPYPISILHVYHNSSDPNSPLYPNKPTHAFKAFAAPLPSEPTFGKSTNSAITSLASPLAAQLSSSGIRQVIVAGISTEHCVSTTTRMLADTNVVGSRDAEGAGRIVVVRDATATFDKVARGIDAETVQKVHLASLEGEFATDVLATEEVLAGLFG